MSLALAPTLWREPVAANAAARASAGALGLAVQLAWGNQVLTAEWVPPGGGLWLEEDSTRRQLVRSEGGFFSVWGDHGPVAACEGATLRVPVGRLEMICTLAPRPASVRGAGLLTCLELLLAAPLVAAAFLTWGAPPKCFAPDNQLKPVPVSHVTFDFSPRPAPPPLPTVAPPR